MANLQCAADSFSPVESVLSINQLPASVLIHILSFLDIEDKCRAAMVCTLWHQMAKEKCLWKRLEIGEMNLCHKIRLSMMLFFNTYIGSSLQTLDISDIDNTLLKYLRSNCPSLSELTLGDANMKFCDLSLLPSSLTFLDFYIDGAAKERQYPSNWYVSFTEDHFPHLKTLKFWHAPNCNAAIKQISSLKSLCCLEMAFLRKGISEGAFSALMGMADLESLAIVSVGRLPVDFSSQIVHNLHNLKELNLTRCEALVVPADLTRFAQLPNLEKLLIPSKSRGFMKALIRAIPSMLKLKRVEFDDMDYCNEVAPKNLAQMLVFLKQIRPEVTFEFRSDSVCGEEDYEYFSRYEYDESDNSESSDDNDM